MTPDQGGFNLIDEPWIPVLELDGQVHEKSLITVFRDAHEAVAIVGELPTQGFAVLRLLLAVLHRSLRSASGGSGPASLAMWRDLEPNWDRVVAEVTGYLNAFRDRFDLFHPTQPFFQVAGLRTAKDEASGLDKLIADVPNGEPFFTTRIGPGISSITPAEAARWLVHVHAFDPAGIRSGAVGDSRVKNGKGYPIGPGWAGQIGGVMLDGDTLRSTLLLNLIAWPESSTGIVSGPDDLPPWEREPLGPAEEVSGGRQPRGPIELYTWQSRRVRLVGDKSGVTAVVLCQGDRLTPQNMHRWEPMTSWRYSKPQTAKLGETTYMPSLHDPSRLFWRGLQALLAHVVQPDSKEPPPLAPAVMAWAGAVALADQAPSSLVRVRAVGLAYGSNNSIISELIDDSLRLPTSLLVADGAALSRTAIDALEVANNVATAMASFRQNLARAAGMGGDESEHERTAGREDTYHLLDQAFRDWLISLGTQDALAATAHWQSTVRRMAEDDAMQWLSSVGPGALVGRIVNGRRLDAGLAHAWFLNKLHQTLPHAYHTTDSNKSAAEEKELV